MDSVAQNILKKKIYITKRPKNKLPHPREEEKENKPEKSSNIFWTIGILVLAILTLQYLSGKSLFF
jgi:hypothetical protein